MLARVAERVLNKQTWDNVPTATAAECGSLDKRATQASGGPLCWNFIKKAEGGLSGQTKRLKAPFVPECGDVRQHSTGMWLGTSGGRRRQTGNCIRMWHRADVLADLHMSVFVLPMSSHLRVTPLFGGRAFSRCRDPGGGTNRVLPWMSSLHPPFHRSA